MRFITFLLMLVLFSSHAQTSNTTIGGYVKEEESGELLYGVVVYCPSLNKGTTTNAYGFFSLAVPSDSVEIIVSYVGYQTYRAKIKPNDNDILNISLSSLATDEVVVIGEESEKVSQINQMSTISITGAQVKDLPAFLGEKDVMKTLQLMPGVQKGTEGSSGIYVRGGGPDQNLIILDDAPVYNVSHLFGFFSIFNGDAIKNVSLMKGGFPARYGGRLSSVVEMNMKDGNKEKIHGEAGIGLLSSRLTLEGPLKKDKSSFLISGRRTYFDLLLLPFMTSENKAGYYFYDFNAKFNYELSPKDKLFVSGYFGLDKLYSKFKDDNSSENFFLKWGNKMGTVRWNHLFNNRLFSNTSLIVSNYDFRIQAEHQSTGRYASNSFARYNSGIFDLTAKLDFNYFPSTRHEIRFGALVTSHRFTPGAFTAKDDQVTYIDRSNTVNAVESGLYAEDNYYITDKLKANGGLRFSSFWVDKKAYSNLEPRLSLAYSINATLSAKASYALMNQYIHLLSNTSVGLPTDLWVPTTDIIKPQQSNQVALGLAKDLPKQNLLVSIEGFYKKMDRIVGYKEGSSYLDFEDEDNFGDYKWEKNVTQGQGWSYGTEFLVQRKVGKWTGWVGYTLSWTQLQFPDVNLGRKFWARYDRRHDISIVSIYKPSSRITLSAVWVFGTGNAFTFSNTLYNAPPDPSASSHSIANPYNAYAREVTDYGQKNGYRMANYHRLDIGIQFHKQKKRCIRTWDIGVYNAYNRANPFAYVPQYNEKTNLMEIFQVSIFPVLPSITYNVKF